MRVELEINSDVFKKAREKASSTFRAVVNTVMTKRLVLITREEKKSKKSKKAKAKKH